ncbi:addiction module protein [Paraliomyxa miuraensis]|uniref:addiction module protein n=1 Tax=Paraliomyxa miuraensis TaxID=376150 RepID=UPI002257D35C|nr:addiction module protein [Paraliomyxa miuraensis]MCX4244311.1 addiction module protein [Paraliomyxa miuraensis]
MSPEVERLLDEAMKLSDDERAVLAVILEDSLGDGSSEEEIEAAWLVEIRRRMAAVESGEAQLIPAEDVERELEEILDRASGPRRAVG